MSFENINGVDLKELLFDGSILRCYVARVFSCISFDF